MKKYKLIKEYPGSPELKTIATRFENSDYYTYPNITAAEILAQNLNDIENNPEFWEEVVEYPIGTKVHNSLTNVIYTKKENGWYKPAEKTAYTDKMISSKKYITILDKSKKVIEKDYEILSFIHDGSNFVSKGNVIFMENGRLKSKHLKFTEEEYLNSNCWSIHSVKRLSDGEIFTIGDEIETCVSKTYASIYGFDIIKNNKLYINHTHSYLLNKKFPDTAPNNHLHLISKKKKPLFTTEDGVEIFKDDKCFVVNNIFAYWQIMSSQYQNREDFKYFSTKEAAEEYIEWNQPKYSLKDIEKAFDCYQYKYNERIIRNLKNSMK